MSIKIHKFRLMGGVHHDKASGNKYTCTPDKRIEPKPDADDQEVKTIPGDHPVFQSAMRLDLVFKNKFILVPEDTPTTASPDGSALTAIAVNEREAKNKVLPTGTPPRGGKKSTEEIDEL